jgi:branched-chain amino acid transport system permease protein
MLDLFADTWGLFGPAVPTFCAILVLSFAARIAWSGGTISFAPIMIAAIGGYCAANLLVAGAGVALALLAAGLVGFWLGLLLAMLLGRLPAHAQSLATLAIAALIGPVSRIVPAWTGGADGIDISALLPPAGQTTALVSLALLAVIIVACSALDRSWFAIAARAVRQNHALAVGMGIQPRIVQTISFGLSGLLAGLGGAMLVLGAGIAAPATFPLSLGFLALAATLLGGAYHWAGPILGGLIFALPAALQGAVTPGLLDIANAVAVIVLLIFLPRGLLDPRDNLRREARERRRQSRATSYAPPPVEDGRRRSSSRRGLQSGHASRLNNAVKRRTGDPR